MQVLQQSFDLYKQRFWACLPLSLVIASGIFAPFLFFEYNEPFSLITELLTWQGYKSAMMIGIWLLTIIAMGALINKINQFYLNQSATTSWCISQALTDFFPVLLVSALYSILVICGLVFLILPGIFVAISLMLSFIIRFVEHLSVFDSIVKSHQLVTKRWWQAFVIMSVPLMLNISTFLAVFITVVSVLTYHAETWEHAYFFAFFLNAGLQVIFIPFIFSTALCLYYDLKDQHS